MTDLVLRPRSATELVDAAFQVFRRAIRCRSSSRRRLVYVPWLVIRLIFQLNVPETPDQITANLMPCALRDRRRSIVIYGLAGGVAAVLTRAVYLDEPIDVAAAFRKPFADRPAHRRPTRDVRPDRHRVVLVHRAGLYSVARFFAVRQAIVLEGAGASPHSGGRASCRKA